MALEYPGYTDTRYATFDVIKVSFHKTPEPGVLAAWTRLRGEMLEQVQLNGRELSVSISIMTCLTKTLPTIQIIVQQKKETATRARIKPALRKVLHATICVRPLSPSPPWGPSSATRLLRWTFLGIPKLQTFSLALAKSFTVQDEILTRQILPREQRNHNFVDITASPLVLLQRGYGLRVGFDSWRAEEDGWLSWRFLRVWGHEVWLVEVYMYAKEGGRGEGMRYWTEGDVVECLPVGKYPGAVLGDVSGETAERLRGYQLEVVNWFEQRKVTGSRDWIAW